MADPTPYAFHFLLAERPAASDAAAWRVALTQALDAGTSPPSVSSDTWWRTALLAWRSTPSILRGDLLAAIDPAPPAAAFAARLDAAAARLAAVAPDSVPAAVAAAFDADMRDAMVAMRQRAAPRQERYRRIAALLDEAARPGAPRSPTAVLGYFRVPCPAPPAGLAAALECLRTHLGLPAAVDFEPRLDEPPGDYFARVLAPDAAWPEPATTAHLSRLSLIAAKMRQLSPVALTRDVFTAAELRDAWNYIQASLAERQRRAAPGQHVDLVWARAVPVRAIGTRAAPRPSPARTPRPCGGCGKLGPGGAELFPHPLTACPELLAARRARGATARFRAADCRFPPCLRCGAAEHALTVPARCAVIVESTSKIPSESYSSTPPQTASSSPPIPPGLPPPPPRSPALDIRPITFPTPPPPGTAAPLPSAFLPRILGDSAWRAEQAACPEIAALRVWVAAGADPESQPTWDGLRPRGHFTVADDLLAYRPKRAAAGTEPAGPWRLCVPPSLRAGIIVAAHEASAHPGARRTYEALSLRVYWPGMAKQVAAHVAGCDRCAESRVAPASVAHSAPVPPRQKLRAWALDLVALYPPESSAPLPSPADLWADPTDGCRHDVNAPGFRYALGVIDQCTRAAVYMGVPSTCAGCVISAVRHLASHYGFPELLFLDRASAHTSRALQTFAASWGIALRFASSSHAAGLIETTNNRLRSILARIADNPRRFTLADLDAANLALRTAPYDNSGITPFFCLFGQAARTPLDTALAISQSAPIVGSAEEVAAATVDLTAAAIAQLNELRVADGEARAADAHDRSPPLLPIGARVRLRQGFVAATNKQARRTYRYGCPATVIGRDADAATYTLADDDGAVHDRVHAARVAPWSERVPPAEPHRPIIPSAVPAEALPYLNPRPPPPRKQPAKRGRRKAAKLSPASAAPVPAVAAPAAAAPAAAAPAAVAPEAPPPIPAPAGARPPPPPERADAGPGVPPAMDPGAHQELDAAPAGPDALPDDVPVPPSAGPAVPADGAAEPLAPPPPPRRSARIAARLGAEPAPQGVAVVTANPASEPGPTGIIVSIRSSSGAVVQALLDTGAAICVVAASSLPLFIDARPAAPPRYVRLSDFSGAADRPEVPVVLISFALCGLTFRDVPAAVIPRAPHDIILALPVLIAAAPLSIDIPPAGGIPAPRLTVRGASCPLSLLDSGDTPVRSVATTPAPAPHRSLVPFSPAHSTRSPLPPLADPDGGWEEVIFGPAIDARFGPGASAELRRLVLTPARRALFRRRLQPGEAPPPCGEVVSLRIRPDADLSVLRRQQPGPRLGGAEAAALAEYVARGVASGLLEEVLGPAPVLSHALVVAKGTPAPGAAPSYRVVIDGRLLNGILMPQAFPIPRAEDGLDSIASAAAAGHIIMAFDSVSAFFQLETAPASRWLLTTQFGDRLYTWRRMSMGSVVAAAYQQARAARVMRAVPFLSHTHADDTHIALPASSLPELAGALGTVFDALIASRYYLAGGKTVVGAANTPMLGYLISSSGLISPSPSTISGIVSWAPPSSRADLFAFVGALSKLRHFVPGLGAALAPLHTLLARTPKRHRLAWGDDAQTAFDTCKSVAVAAVRRHPHDPAAPVAVLTDGAEGGLAAWVFQRRARSWRLILAYGRRTSSVEQGGSPGLREVSAMYSLVRSHSYLFHPSAGEPAVWWTDAQRVHRPDVLESSSRSADPLIRARLAFIGARARLTVLNVPREALALPDAAAKAFEP
jgi:hypothetical protein